MKKQILLAIAVIIFFNALAAANVSAQSGKAVKVNVAFDFQAKGKTFPAGEYYIGALSRANDSAFFIRSASSGENQIIIGNQLYAGKTQVPKLIFERRGENYFLTGIFLENGQWGLSLPMTRRKTGKNIASRSSEILELPLSK